MPLAVKSLLLIALLLAALWGWVQYRAQAHEARAEAAFPPEGQIITVDGHTVHAVVTGQGPDLVLIHGASGNTRDLTFDLAPRLARHYRLGGRLRLCGRPDSQLGRTPVRSGKSRRVKGLL
jgi:hypothetical protein